MSRILRLKLPDGTSSTLHEVPADNEHHLQMQLRDHPELLPLGELGVAGLPVVVGWESNLDAGRPDLILLGSAGELILVEFKTGPKNRDFRECLAQLLDYGSSLWRMSVEEFDASVAQPYFSGPHSQGPSAHFASLADAALKTWADGEPDPVGWQDGLEARLRDGAFHYVAVAERFTPSVLDTIAYLNSTSTSRFSAVELIRFTASDGTSFEAFEARVVATPPPNKGASPQSKATLAGAEAFVSSIADAAYRRALTDFFQSLAEVEGLSVYWGTKGCSLRVPLATGKRLSIGWVFPPQESGNMGVTDVTLGWHKDAKALDGSPGILAALDGYRDQLDAVPGGGVPAPAVVGTTFGEEAFVPAVPTLVEAVRGVVTALLEA